MNNLQISYSTDPQGKDKGRKNLRISFASRRHWQRHRYNLTARHWILKRFLKNPLLKWFLWVDMKHKFRFLPGCNLQGRTNHMHTLTLTHRTFFWVLGKPFKQVAIIRRHFTLKSFELLEFPYTNTANSEGMSPFPNRNNPTCTHTNTVAPSIITPNEQQRTVWRSLNRHVPALAQTWN